MKFQNLLTLSILICQVGFTQIVKPVRQYKAVSLDTAKTQSSKANNQFQQTNISNFSLYGSGILRSKFNPNAKGLNPVNAYILCYLNTMIYPQYLGPTLSPKREEPKEGPPSLGYAYLAGVSDTFEQKFIEKIGPLFMFNKNDKTVSFEFITNCNPNGYDPEAMLISTEDVVYVIFRGTDRVGCADPNETGLYDGYLKYNWNGWKNNEWIKSDFEGLGIQVDVGNRGIISGKVNPSFWKSLTADGFIDILSQKVKSKMTGGKKLWIAGHSLGGAQAQLFTLYLAGKYFIKTHGLYLFSSPHAGNDLFVNELEAVVGENNIQRFVFKSDPITIMPPMSYPFNYARAGKKNYFCDIGFMEKDAADIEEMVLWDFCFHHPTWILRGLYNELSANDKIDLPTEYDLPKTDNYCFVPNQRTVALRDEGCRVRSQAANAVSGILEDVQWVINNIADNALGTAIEPGKYRFINYLHSKKSKKYLTRKTCTLKDPIIPPITNSDIECDSKQLFLDKKRSGNKQIFEIKRDGLLNYIICNPNNNNSVVEIDVLKVNTNGADVDMGEKAWSDAVGNEHWWFFKYISPSGKKYYLIRSQSAPGKMLDAADSCNGSEGNCSVNVWSALPGNKSQVWILEKVD